MQKIVAVQDYSGLDGSELQELKAALQEWDLKFELRKTSLPSDAARVTEEEILKSLAKRPLEDVKQVVVLGARLRNYIYDKTTGCFFSLARQKDASERLSWILVSL